MRWVIAVGVLSCGCSQPEPTPPGNTEVEVPVPHSAAAVSTASSTGPILSAMSSAAPPPLTSPPPPAAYFPRGTFQDATQDLVATWYSKHLVVMRERPLSETPASADAVRFLWLRTWGKPVTVRVVRNAGNVELVAVRLSGSGGYEPGDVELFRRRKLDDAAWKRIEDALAAAKFETTPTSAEMGHDGAQWVLERAHGGKVRLVERWTPDASGPHAAFRAACQVLLDLAGPEIVNGDVY